MLEFDIFDSTVLCFSHLSFLRPHEDHKRNSDAKLKGCTVVVPQLVVEHQWKIQTFTVTFVCLSSVCFSSRLPVYNSLLQCHLVVTICANTSIAPSSLVQPSAMVLCHSSLVPWCFAIPAPFIHNEASDSDTSGKWLSRHVIVMNV